MYKIDTVVLVCFGNEMVVVVVTGVGCDETMFSTRRRNSRQWDPPARDSFADIRHRCEVERSRQVILGWIGHIG